MSSESDTTSALIGAQPEASLSGWIALAKMCSDLFDQPRAPVTLGRYMVLERVGAGGMGVVYAAYDPEMDRKVAIKILPAGSDASATARLLREARALAGVSHPNVVELYDIGTLEHRSEHEPRGPAGLFMVMELVDGVDVERWLREGRRSWQQVLAVFMHAGRGLAAVHEVGLVHGDVKPSNIVIGGDGRVRVLDFGLARTHAATDDDGAVMGTPAYMAPEQHRGQPLDARADQFAWCASLHRALYGQMPFAGDDSDALARAKTRGELQPPRARHGVPRWLHDAITRGLATAPQQRFADMPALLDELARRWSWHRRRAWMVGSVALIGAATGAVLYPSAGPSCPGEQQWREAWDTARQERVGEALSATGSGLARDTLVRVSGHLGAYAEAGRQLHHASCVAAPTAAATDDFLDRRLACLRRRLAELHAVTAVLEDADATVVEHAVEAALRLTPIEQCADDAQLAALRGPSSPQAEAIRDRIAALDVSFTIGRYREGLERARAVHDEALALADPWLAVEALRRLGNFEQELGRDEDAVRHLSDAALQALGLGDDLGVAAAANDLVFVLHSRMARVDEASTWARHAQAAIERTDPDGLQQARLLSVRGGMRGELGEHAAAVEDLRRALEIQTRLLGTDHPNIANTLNNLGVTTMVMGDLVAARGYYEQALAMRERMLGPVHPHLIASLTNLGATLWTMGEEARAQALLERALKLARDTLGPDHPTVELSLANLGTSLLMRERFAEAKPLLTEALALAERALPSSHPERAQAHVRLGTALQGLGDFEGARQQHEAALASLEQFGARHHQLGGTLFGLGEALRSLGRTDDAQRRYLEAVAAYERSLGPDAVALVEPLGALAELALAAGDRDEAQALVTRALACAENGEVSPDTEAWLRRTLDGAKAHD